MEDAIGPVVFQWFTAEKMDSHYIHESGKISVTSTDSYSLLVIDTVSASDGGLYCCTAADYSSNITKEFNISVKGECGMIACNC